MNLPCCAECGHSVTEHTKDGPCYCGCRGFTPYEKEVSK